MVVVGVLSVVAVAVFDTAQPRLQYEILLQKIADDVRYAQHLAMSAGQGTSVFIDQVNNRYFLKWADGTYVKKPVGGDNFVVQLGSDEFAQVTITGSGFAYGRLDFDRTGTPRNNGAPFQGTLSLVTLNQAKHLLIVGTTGYAKIQGN